MHKECAFRSRPFYFSIEHYQDVRGGSCADYFRLRQRCTFSVFGSTFSPTEKMWNQKRFASTQSQVKRSGDGNDRVRPDYNAARPRSGGVVWRGTALSQVKRSSDGNDRVRPDYNAARPRSGEVVWRGTAPPGVTLSAWCSGFAATPGRQVRGAAARATPVGERSPERVQHVSQRGMVIVSPVRAFSIARVQHVTVQVGWSGGALPLRESLRFGPFWRRSRQNRPKQRLCGGLRPPRLCRRRYHLNGYVQHDG